MFLKHQCEMQRATSIFVCAGKNNQGLKQVMAKFSPAWALLFSIACDPEGMPRRFVGDHAVLTNTCTLQHCLPNTGKVPPLVARMW